MLSEVRKATNLAELTQLTELSLYGVDVEYDLGLLATSLQRLNLCGEQPGHSLAELTSLTRVEMDGCSGDALRTALHDLEQLPALACLVLRAREGALHRALRLASVRTLLLTFGVRQEHYLCNLDLTAMVQLHQLALNGLSGASTIAAPTVACLQLGMPRMRMRHLPSMVACTSMSLLQLVVPPAASATTVLIDDVRLPAQQLRIDVCVTPPDRIFRPDGDMHNIQLHYVDQIAWLLEDVSKAWRLEHM